MNRLSETVVEDPLEDSHNEEDWMSSLSDDSTVDYDGELATNTLRISINVPFEGTTVDVPRVKNQLNMLRASVLSIEPATDATVFRREQPPTINDISIIDLDAIGIIAASRGAGAERTGNPCTLIVEPATFPVNRNMYFAQTMWNKMVSHKEQIADVLAGIVACL